MRRDLTAKAQTVGLPADFLETVEFEARHFIALQQREFELERKLGIGEGDVNMFAALRATRQSECPALADRIQRLQKTFGSSLDRFLYSAVATAVFREFDAPVSAQELRWKEEGCR